jgi:NADH-quinone oxidoreductase subunit K
MVPLNYYIILAGIVFAIGLYGVMSQRNGIRILMFLELLLNAGNINLVAFSSHLGNSTGQVFALFSIAIAAAEAAIGFAILIALFRVRDTIDIHDINILRW